MIKRLNLILLFLPSLASILYFGLFAAPRYVSEAQFVVRNAAKPIGASGLGAILQMSGLGRANEDVFAVQAFMTSRSAADQLSKRLPLRDIYGHPDADPIAAYPSVVYGPSNEELHRYLSWMVWPVYSSTSGITTLKVQAFSAEDARRVAAELLDLSEQTVNQMNERIQRDSVSTAQNEVKRNEERLVAAQQAITRFRNSELIIDPAGSSVVIIEVIGRLSGEMAQTEAQIREISTGSDSNPQLQSLNRRVDALQDQIARERGRISNEEDGLARKLAVYERLVLDREFAKQALEAAVRTLEASQTEARKQQLFLERIVEPIAADRAMAPERLWMIITAFALNLVFVLVGWLVISGLSEHAAQRH